MRKKLYNIVIEQNVVNILWKIFLQTRSVYGEKIENREIQMFVFTGLLVFTDKVIRREDSEKIRGWLGMTKVGQIIAEEIEQAVSEVRRQADKEKKEAVQEATKDANYSTARKLLECGVSVDQILQCIDGLTRGEVERMR